MAFPKKHSRRIVVDGVTYLWRLKQGYAWRDGQHIAICPATDAGQLLLVEYYAFQGMIGPGMVRQAIDFALANGWTPTRRARRPLYVGFDGANSIVLPEGALYTHTFFGHPLVAV